ncbi:MAG: hypothetical protein AAF919_01970 [Pseudomonadota bacterium]
MSIITSILGGQQTGGPTDPGRSGDAPGQNKDKTDGSQQTGDSTSGQGDTGTSTGTGGATGETTQSGSQIAPVRESISVTGASAARSGGDGALVEDSARLEAAFSPVLSEDQARQLAEAARDRTEQQSIVERVAEGQKEASERFEASVEEVREASEPPADNRIDRAA